MLREVIDLHNLDAERTLETNLVKYADWLGKTEPQEMNETIFSLRDRYPSRFLDLCSFHLSTLVDISTDFLESIESKYNKGDGGILSQRGITMSPKNNIFDKLFHSKLSGSCNQSQKNCQDIISSINYLIEKLDKPENLMTEGIFRKSGNIARQKEFKRQIVQGQKNILESIDKLGVHDMASSLKTLLKELPKPIFTEEFVQLIRKISDLTSGGVNDEGVRIPLKPLEEGIAISKQLKAMRICAMFLPKENATLLKKLMNLLTNCLKYSESNLMSSDSLGTLFGVILFAPGKVPLKNVQYVYSNISKLTSTIIKYGCESLFSIPSSLAHDIRANCRDKVSKCSLEVNSPTLFSVNSPSSYETNSLDSGLDCCDSDSNPSTVSLSSFSVTPNQSTDPSNSPLKTELAYVHLNNISDSNKTITPSEKFSPATEYAVAELYAHVHKMTKDGKKKKLIEKFNNSSNGGIIPSRYNLRSKGDNKMKRTPEEAENIRFGLKKKLKNTEDQTAQQNETDKLLCYPFLETISSPFRKNMTSTVKRIGKIHPQAVKEFEDIQKTCSDSSPEFDDVSPNRVFFDSDIDNEDQSDFNEDDFHYEPVVRKSLANNHPFSDVWLDDMLHLVRLRRTRSLGDVSEILQ